ncbi:MAG: glycosyltransferase, partial [Dehalococcoidales bacterium]|nr:glycosyltransferase [Dehalococcoidales bacterium]
GEALKTAIAQARAENIIWIDADDTYPTELLPKVRQAFRTYDMVVCSRKYGQENIPSFNRVGNFIFRTMIKAIYNFKPYDPCSGLYGAKKSHLKMMNLSAHRFAIEPEISIKGARMRLKMLDIPIQYKARVGKAKLNSIIVGFEDLWTILRLIFWHPAKVGNG